MHGAVPASGGMNDRGDYYQVLGVPRDAEAKGLKKASRRYHPDSCWCWP